MELSRSQQILLEAIHTHDGEWNDYKLGRSCLSRLDSPTDFTLRPLLDAGLIEERSVENEPLPRLFMTDAGKRALEASPNSVE